jgi:hypothetical protein
LPTVKEVFPSSTWEERENEEGLRAKFKQESLSFFTGLKDELLPPPTQAVNYDSVIAASHAPAVVVGPASWSLDAPRNSLLLKLPLAPLFVKLTDIEFALTEVARMATRYPF